MKRLSRLLTFVLAFVLCMSMGIATTLADDGPEAKWSADGGTWQEGTLMDAVWAAYGADAKIEIQLQRSVTLDASWYPQHLGYSGVELILDGQGSVSYTHLFGVWWVCILPISFQMVGGLHKWE